MKYDIVDLLNTGAASALIYAKGKHDATGATYRGETYFYGHVVRVACLVAEMTTNQDTIIAAILHDVVEDTDATIEEITKLFGENVALIVADLTKKPGTNYMEYLMDLQRKSSIIVKYCDMLVNSEEPLSPKHKMKYEMGLAYFRRYHAEDLGLS
jgi:(p)ppGpp synthase/HD superfamily hydrolase